MSCQIPPRKKTVSSRLSPSRPPDFPAPRRHRSPYSNPPWWVCVSGKAGLPLVNHGPGRAPSPTQVGEKAGHFRGPLLMSSGSLLSDWAEWSGCSCDPSAPERQCPNSHLSSYLSAPQECCLLWTWSPGALLYPVSGKPGLALSEGRKDRKEELGSLLGEG